MVSVLTSSCSPRGCCAPCQLLGALAGRAARRMVVDGAARVLVVPGALWSCEYEIRIE